MDGVYDNAFDNGKNQSMEEINFFEYISDIEYIKHIPFFMCIKNLNNTKMSDVHDQRIFAAEQIEVPDNFPGILKNYIKEIVRAGPENIVQFSRQYFEELIK